jgi:toxin ParE1/3/4
VNRATFNRLAERELAEAVRHYERESQGLGRRFYEEVLRAISLIERYPEAAPRFRGETRRLILPKFPYALMYRSVEGGLRILAVAHHKRHPDYWIRRA